MYEVFGWNQNNMFFLSRDYPLEPITEAKKLFYYANQVLTPDDVRLPADALDRFGRNHIDRTFIALCIQLDVLAACNHIAFKSLTCEKVADKYVMRVRFDDEDVEMELTEAVDYFSRKLEDGRRSP